MCSKIVAKIEPVRYGLDAICTIISDDGMPLTVEELYKIAVKYCMKITVAQTIMNISNLQRLQEFERSNHLEFISHSFDHRNMGMNGISKQILYHEIIESKEYMERHFSTSQIAFIPPNNQLSREAYNICNGNFYAIRRYTREFNSLSPFSGEEPLNWFNLGCKGIGDVNTTQERNEWIDKCIDSKKWIIEMWHNIDRDSSTGYQTITPSEAEEHVAYICEKRDKKKLWVASFVEVVKYIFEAQTTKINISKKNENEWEIVLSKGISEIDPRFNIPLSIRIDLCQKFKKVTIIDNKGVKEIKQDISMIQNEIFPGENITILTN